MPSSYLVLAKFSSTNMEVISRLVGSLPYFFFSFFLTAQKEQVKERRRILFDWYEVITLYIGLFIYTLPPVEEWKWTVLKFGCGPVVHT